MNVHRDARCDRNRYLIKDRKRPGSHFSINKCIVISWGDFTETLLWRLAMIKISMFRLLHRKFHRFKPLSLTRNTIDSEHRNRCSLIVKIFFAIVTKWDVEVESRSFSEQDVRSKHAVFLPNVCYLYKCACVWCKTSDKYRRIIGWDYRFYPWIVASLFYWRITVFASFCKVFILDFYLIR